LRKEKRREKMKNIKKCMEIYANSTIGASEAGLKLIKNGQYRNNMDEEDIEFARFMIGGMGAK
jgi:thiamine monophosphate kinase